VSKVCYCRECGYMQNMAFCEKCKDHKPYKNKNKGTSKTIVGHVNVPVGGFKLDTITVYLKKEDAEAVARDKSRIQLVSFEVVE